MYTYMKTRYENGQIDGTCFPGDEYATRDEAIKAARDMAKYWKYNYAAAPDVAHASYMETPQGATILVELKDGRNILTYFEVASE